MSIEIEEINETRVVWTTHLPVSIEGNEQKKQTEVIQLNRFPTCSSYFEISCETHSDVVPTGPTPVSHGLTRLNFGASSFPLNKPIIVELSIRPVDDSFGGPLTGSNKKEERVSSEYYNRPSVVCVNVTANNNCSVGKFQLNTSDGSEEFKSEKITISRQNHGPVPITFQFSILFPFYRGESNLLKNLTELFVQQNNCDFKFVFQGDEKQILGAHACILAARSSVFATMFNQSFQESTTGKTNIDDIQLNIFEELLYYIYSGRTKTELNEDIAQPLYTAADKYDIDDLKKECAQFLVSCIKVENILDLLVWADLYKVEELKKSSLNFLAEHGKSVCQLEKFDEFMKEYPDLCLQATRCMIMTTAPNMQ